MDADRFQWCVQGPGQRPTSVFAAMQHQPPLHAHMLHKGNLADEAVSMETANYLTERGEKKETIPEQEPPLLLLTQSELSFLTFT